MSSPAADQMARRKFLAGGVGIAAGVGILGPAAFSTSAPAAVTSLFGHGVASGDPLPDAVVLWTRVTPTRESVPGSGLGPDVSVVWEVGDADFEQVVRRGVERTGPHRDHTVKVDVTGLEPGTDYHYRFTVAGDVSQTGRTRTAPAPSDAPTSLRFGVVSCANWQAGWFSPYRHLAERGDLDAVVHLGDYLYEYQPGTYSYGHDNVDVRRHDPPRETVSLSDYRRRHAQYKTDDDLQALHAAVPFIVTWDDHEVADGNGAHGAFGHQPKTEGSWKARVTAAHRAYDEWMPVRISGTAVTGDGDRIYRRLQFGTLADLSMLDLRSYRSERVQPDDPAVGAAGRTIAGGAQLAWLGGNLATSPCTWKLVGNPVMMSPLVLPPRPIAEEYALSQTVTFTPARPSEPNTDGWDGYTSDRQLLLDRIEADGVQNTVFLTGDVHSAWANEVPSPTTGVPVATELVCASITSNNVDDFMGARPRTVSLALEAAIQEENRHVRWVNLDDHGYTVLHVAPERVQMDWYAISDRADPAATSRRLASWSVAAGGARLTPALDAGPA